MAVRFLEARPRSTHETRHRLVDRGYRADLVENTIARLTELRILDDEAFTRSWVESRDRAHPRGAVALRRELRLKGIPDDLIATVLALRDEAAADPRTGDRNGAESAADESAAERLLTRKAAALGRVKDPRLRRRRAYALLARHGFDPDVCARVASRVAAGSAQNA